MDARGQVPGRPSRRQRTRQQHREEILSAATDLFARYGYDGTSMQMIADGAEISVGKLYLHFEGKEAIYREVAEYHAGEIRRLSAEVVDPSAPPLDRIRARTGAVIRYLDEHDDFVRFYVSEMEMTGRKCCHMDKSGHARHMMEFRDLIREAVSRGDIPDVDPDLLTAMIHGAGHALATVIVERGGLSFGIAADYVDRIILKPLEERQIEEKRKGGGA